jgi:hypothetical protein
VQEPESDEDETGRVDVVASAALAAKPSEVVALSPQRSSSHSSSSSSSSSSTSGSEGENQINVGGSAAGAPSLRQAIAGKEDSEKSSSQAARDAYFVSQEDPASVAAELNALGAKLVGGCVLGSLRFESNRRERGFLSEASGSFCLPLMEKELMKTGTTNILRCVEDLALKAHVGARCASRYDGLKPKAAPVPR